jgi:hypothetical protein
VAYKRKRRRTVVPPSEYEPLRRRGPKYDLTQPPEPELPRLSPTDTKQLARLVGKYGPETVATAAGKVFLRSRGRPKLGFVPPRLAELPPADTKALARLTSKYGRAFIATAAKGIGLRRRGRPSLGRLPEYDVMHVADWLNQVAAEYSGARYPLNCAALDLHELLFGRDAPVSDAWLKTTKNKRLLGEQGFRDLARRIQEHPDWAKARGMRLSSLPSWLKTRK